MSKLFYCYAIMFFVGNNCFSVSYALTEKSTCSFSGILRVLVNSDEGAIRFSKSADNVTRVHATGPDAERAVIYQEGNVLKVENKRGFWGWGFSRRADFLIELAKNLIPEADISLGSGGVEIKTNVQNLKINAGNLELYAEDLTGNSKISAANGILTLVHKVVKRVSYSINAGSVKITSLLARGYNGVSNQMRGGNVQLKEATLPIRYDDADFCLSGNVGKADLFFRNLD